MLDSRLEPLRRPRKLHERRVHVPQLTPLNLVPDTSRHLFECSLAWGTFGLWSGGLLRPFDRVPRHHQGEAGGGEGSIVAWQVERSAREDLSACLGYDCFLRVPVSFESLVLRRCQVQVGLCRYLAVFLHLLGHPARVWLSVRVSTRSRDEFHGGPATVGDPATFCKMVPGHKVGRGRRRRRDKREETNAE